MFYWLMRHSKNLKNYYRTRIKHAFPRHIRKKKTSFPRTIQIQTTSFCNTKCMMCPYGEIVNELSQGQMDWDLYKKITDECSKNNIHEIDLFLMNEPLMDKHLINHMQYAREKNPNAIIVMSTNASLLNPEKAKEITEYVDVVNVSLHSFDKKEYERIMPGLNFDITLANIEYLISLIKKRNKKIRTRLVFIYPLSFLKKFVNYQHLEHIKNYCGSKRVEYQIKLFFNRAGNVACNATFMQNPMRRTKLNGCVGKISESPLRLMPVLYNGDVLLCCMDWRREVIIGNLNRQSISEIWNSKTYEKILDKIYLGRKVKEDFLCTRCVTPYNFSWLLYSSISAIYLSFREVMSQIKKMINIDAR